MGNKVFQGVVVLLWAASMSWLVGAKMLPKFFRGQAPRAGSTQFGEPVGWRIEMLGRPCGVAVSSAAEGVGGAREVHSRVKLDRLPLAQKAPQWMLSLLKNLGDIRLDLRNRATFDSLGGLAMFKTRVQVNGVDSIVRMSGVVHDGKLRLKMQTGDFTRRSEHPWREESMLGGQLSPEAKLINIYVGRKWRDEVYSPFGAPGAPAELVEAQVDAEDTLLYGGELTRVHRIVYRSLSAAGVSARDRLRAIVWVREDGRVLRQDSYFMNVRLRFCRLTDAESAELADELLDLDLYSATTTPESDVEPGSGAFRSNGGEPTEHSELPQSLAL